MQTPYTFIAVHAGAGFHSHDKEKEYKVVCKDACKQAMEILGTGGNALAAITKAVSVLENSRLTNAGVGSNLTLDGTVECDAAVMDGKTLTFGAVGCVTDVQNPVEIARHLVETQLQGCLPLGRIPPSVLVGGGARQWAEEQHLHLTAREGLVTGDCALSHDRQVVWGKTGNDVTYSQTGNDVTSQDTQVKSSSRVQDGSTVKTVLQAIEDASKRTYLKYKKKLDRHGAGSDDVGVSDVKRQTKPGDIASSSTDQASTCRQADVIKSEGPEQSDESSGVQDTVGAVCVDACGNMAAASSSGGIWLKHAGRLGPAAQYGAGCWADDGDTDRLPGVAVVTSGGGEHLMKTLLAKSCAEKVQCGENASLGVSAAFRDNFLESRFLKSIENKHGGALVLKHQQIEDSREVEVMWAHTTDSMCVGYQLNSHSKPTTFISRLPSASIPGKSFTMEGKCFRMQLRDSDTL